MGLRDELVGAWKLVSYVEKPVDGMSDVLPFGEHPRGIIMYTPDGYMSAQLMHGDGRPGFASGDWFDGTPEEYVAEASTYIAYTGPFHVDEAQRTLTHTMFISLFPNLIGQTQPRVVDLQGDVLKLSTASPMRSAGRTVNAYLEWHRAEANPGDSQ
jgi:hypothetical protein